MSRNTRIAAALVASMAAVGTTPLASAATQPNVARAAYTTPPGFSADATGLVGVWDMVGTGADYTLQGRPRHLTDGAGWSFSTQVVNEILTVRMVGPDPAHQVVDDWFLIRSAPGPLRVGTVVRKDLLPTDENRYYMVRVGGEGRGCASDTGAMTITRLERNRAGAVTALDASFVQYCWGPGRTRKDPDRVISAITGQLSIATPRSYVAPNPATPTRVVRGRAPKVSGTVPCTATERTTIGGTVAWTRRGRTTTAPFTTTLRCVKGHPARWSAPLRTKAAVPASGQVLAVTTTKAVRSRSWTRVWTTSSLLRMQ